MVRTVISNCCLPRLHCYFSFSRLNLSQQQSGNLWGDNPVMSLCSVSPLRYLRHVTWTVARGREGAGPFSCGVPGAMMSLITWNTRVHRLTPAAEILTSDTKLAVEYGTTSLKQPNECFTSYSFGLQHADLGFGSALTNQLNDSDTVILKRFLFLFQTDVSVRYNPEA